MSVNPMVASAAGEMLMVRVPHDLYRLLWDRAMERQVSLDSLIAEALRAWSSDG